MLDKNLETNLIIPSGYTILLELPRQELKEPEKTILGDKETLIQSTQTFLTAIPLVSFFFNLSMQHLWGSIISLQIMAHLPILSFTIPPNVKIYYDVMVSVVTFDLFGYFIEGVNFG